MCFLGACTCVQRGSAVVAMGIDWDGGVRWSAALGAHATRWCRATSMVCFYRAAFLAALAVAIVRYALAINTPT